MKNTIRKSVLLSLALLIGINYLHYLRPKVEAASLSWKDIRKFNKIILDGVIAHPDFTFETENRVKSKIYKDEIFEATAYCLRGKTASGIYVKKGIVAADPKVLRLGTRIHLTAGRYSGNYLVADTGKKIKGKTLDIWVPSCAEARRWGRKKVKVKIIGKVSFKGKARRGKK